MALENPICLRNAKIPAKERTKKKIEFKNVFSTNLLSNYMLIYARLRVKAYYLLLFIHLLQPSH